MHITLHYNTISTFIYVYIHIYLRGQSPGIYIYMHIYTPRTKSWYIDIYIIYNSKDKVLDYKKTTSLFGTLPVRQASYCFDVSIYRHRDTYDMYMYLPPRTKSWYIYI